MKGFGIYVKNDLLEPKHVKNMSEAVWLYLWLLDKMTSVNENGVGKVLGNRPITYAEVAADLGIHQNTYTKYVKILKSYNYIDTLRTPRGMVITIHKAKKGFTRTSDSHTRVIHTKRTSDSHERVNAEDSHETWNPIKTKQSRLNKTKQPTASSAGEHRELVSKLYYEVIKSLDLPKTNNNNIRKRIVEMSSDPEHQKIINYLTFMRDQYKTLDWKFKPIVTTALQISDKRAAVRETFARHVKGDNRGVTVI